MGFDVHAYHACKKLKEQSQLGKVITLGRQELHLPNKYLKEVKTTDQRKEQYSEKFICSSFNASCVESIDANNYENPTYIHDFNTPIEISTNKHLIGSYDTVLDIGTTEHVFNLPTALNNAAKLASESGGRLVHILVANNCLGHGFYQLSPELFYSAYRPENGFNKTEIYLAEVFNYKYWYKVNFNKGERIEIGTWSPTYVIVKTEICKHVDLREWKVQQSDYEAMWNSTNKEDQFIPIKVRKQKENLLTRKLKESYAGKAKNIYKALSNLSWTKHPCLTRLTLEKKEASR